MRNVYSRSIFREGTSKDNMQNSKFMFLRDFRRAGSELEDYLLAIGLYQFLSEMVFWSTSFLRGRVSLGK